jgi:CRP-like cAMP-binding protein
MKVDLQEVEPALRAVPYFAELPPELLKPVAQTAIRRRYDPGQLVILEGEPAFGLYIVQEGWLKAVKIALDGREQTLQFLGPGEIFNAVSVFTDALNPATVSALEPSTLWVVPRDAMLRLLEAYPGLARQVIQNLAGRMLHLLALVEDLSLRTVEARLARMLLEQAELATVTRQRWATQAEMASRLGTVPDVVSRVLRKFADDGLIEVARRQIKILDHPGLEARAMIE